MKFDQETQIEHEESLWLLEHLKESNLNILGFVTFLETYIDSTKYTMKTYTWDFPDNDVGLLCEINLKLRDNDPAIEEIKDCFYRILTGAEFGAFVSGSRRLFGGDYENNSIHTILLAYIRHYRMKTYLRTCEPSKNQQEHTNE